MILAIDVGNTNTVIGGLYTDGSCIGGTCTEAALAEAASVKDSYSDGKYPRAAFSLRTRSNTLKIKELLEKISKGRVDDGQLSDIPIFEGAIISSVIPKIVPQICKMINLLFGINTMVVDPKMKMWINIPEQYHEELGPDIIVGLEAAAHEYASPLAVIDMGTASTIFAIDKDRTLIGGTIHPGIGIELKSLCTNTAMLPRINFEVPKYVTGKNTAECIQSGVFYGHAGMVDTILEHMEAELGESMNAVATGGLGRYIAPLCRRKVDYDEDLLFKGLFFLYEQNK